jgi:hypothetical protein
MKLPRKLFRNFRKPSPAQSEASTKPVPSTTPKSEPTGAPWGTRPPTPEEPRANRIDLKRTRPTGAVQRREAIYPAEDPPGSASGKASPGTGSQGRRPMEPTTSPSAAPGKPIPARPDRPIARPQASTPRQPPRKAEGDRRPRVMPTMGRRTPAPAEEDEPRGAKEKRLKSGAELRKMIGPPMQYDDET